MARDQTLFKFISSRVDPALLIDFHLQSEREALDLAEMSLLQLVDSQRLNDEIHRSAEKIQKAFQSILGEEVSDELASDKLIQCRSAWMKARVDFYRKWLSLSEETSSSLELAAKTFRSAKNFDKDLRLLLLTDKAYGDEVVRVTQSMFRFLMRKQVQPFAWLRLNPNSDKLKQWFRFSLIL
jgi:hypothetical protein